MVRLLAGEKREEMIWAAAVLDRGRLKSYQEARTKSYRSKATGKRKIRVGATHQRRVVEDIEKNGNANQSRESRADVEGKVEFIEDSDPARCRGRKRGSAEGEVEGWRGQEKERESPHRTVRVQAATKGQERRRIDVTQLRLHLRNPHAQECRSCSRRRSLESFLMKSLKSSLHSVC